jgi:TolB protein
MPRTISILRLFSASIAIASLLAACSGGSGTEPVTPGATGSPGNSSAWTGEPEGILAFVSFRGGDQEIFVKDLPDGEETNLTNDPAEDFDPDISEDGSKIAFVSNREGAGQTHIYVMDVDGGGLEQITEGSGGAQTPRWSRDGTRIAFSLGGAGVAVMDADGGNVRELLRTDATGEPAPCKSGAFVGGWSPDDSDIIYYSPVGTEEGQLCLLSAEGGEPEVLLDAPGELAAEPVISPDGKSVVYRGIVGGQHDIWLLDIATGERTNITDDADLDIEPDWSPDGQWIAFGSLRPGAPFFDLFIMRPDGTDVRQVTTDPAKEANPVWGRKSKE